MLDNLANPVAEPTMLASFNALLLAWQNEQLVWQNPLWLWGLLLPLVFWLLQRVKQRQQKQGFADAHLWPWVKADNHLVTIKQNLFQRLLVSFSQIMSATKLLSLAWLSLVIAMAGPSSLDADFKIDSRQGVDVMFDIDLSQSMLAKDMGVSRFTFARNLTESVLNELKTQDRVGLNVFAGQSHSVIPLTHDKSVFQQGLNTISPGLLPLQGSWLERALIESLNLFTQTSNGAKVLVVLTDGAPPFWKPADLPEAVQNLPSFTWLNNREVRAKSGVKVIYVGVGLTKNATIPDSQNESKPLRANGLLVQTRLEEAQLKRLAQQSGGLYLPANASQQFIDRLTAEIVSHTQAQPRKTAMQQWHYYSMPFLWLGLFFLVMAFYGRTLLFASVEWLYMRLTKVFKKPSNANQANSVAVLSAGLLITTLFLSSLPQTVVAASNAQQQINLQQAYAAFASEDYDTAEAYYDGIDSFAGLFGAGSAAYRLQDLETAMLYFRAAAWQADEDKQRAQALYNLGNSYYLSNLLPQAIQAYQEALKYQTPYAKAEHNLALAKQRQKQEMRGRQREDESGDGQGQGSQGQDSEGAFYGGQQPNSNNSDGRGGDGDAEDGSRHGNQVNIPEAETATDYRLNPSIRELRLNSAENQSQTNTVLQSQRQQQRAEKFEHELQKLQDDQQVLLKRLFEREAGFEAVQQKPHPIPGVQPW